MFTAMRMYGCMHGLMRSFTGMSFCAMFAEINITYMVAHLCVGSIIEQSQEEPIMACPMGDPSLTPCILSHHPSLLASAVAWRWVAFVIALLHTPILGEGVLSAMNALVSKASVRFLFFLIIGYFGALNAYFVFPIEEHVGRSELLFLKVYRLAFLGDFDLYELEGLDPAFDGHIGKGGKLEGGLDDPSEEGIIYKHGIRVFFVCVSFFFTISFMNVYIGILSNEYDTFRAWSRQTSLQLRSRLMARQLRMRMALPELFRRFCLKSLENIVSEDPHPRSGVWLLFDKSLVLSGESDSDEVSEIKQTRAEVKELKGEIARLTKMVEMSQSWAPSTHHHHHGDAMANGSPAAARTPAGKHTPTSSSRHV
jgi:hypothetical protein